MSSEPTLQEELRALVRKWKGIEREPSDTTVANQFLLECESAYYGIDKEETEPAVLGRDFCRFQPGVEVVDLRLLPPQVPIWMVDAYDPALIGAWVWCEREMARVGRSLSVEALKDAAQEQGMNRSFSLLLDHLLLENMIWDVTDPEDEADSTKQQANVVPALHEPRLVETAQKGQHVLYRHLDDDGKLLYVGVSLDVKARTKAHRSSPWWSRVDRVTVEICDSRADALRKELECIVTEKPAMNKSDRAYATDPVLLREIQP